MRTILLVFVHTQRTVLRIQRIVVRTDGFLQTVLGPTPRGDHTRKNHNSITAIPTPGWSCYGGSRSFWSHEYRPISRVRFRKSLVAIYFRPKSRKNAIARCLCRKPTPRASIRSNRLIFPNGDGVSRRCHRLFIHLPDKVTERMYAATSIAVFQFPDTLWPGPIHVEGAFNILPSVLERHLFSHLKQCRSSRA